MIRLALLLTLLVSAACTAITAKERASLRDTNQFAYDTGYIGEEEYRQNAEALDKDASGGQLLNLLAIFLGGAVGGATGKPIARGTIHGTRLVGRGVLAVARKISRQQQVNPSA